MLSYQSLSPPHPQNVAISEKKNSGQILKFIVTKKGANKISTSNFGFAQKVFCRTFHPVEF